MFFLTLNLSTIGYALVFVNEKACQIAKDKIDVAMKDDPAGWMELTDDFSGSVAFRPKDLLGRYSIDKSRECEKMIQNKMLELRMNIELQQRVNGDPKIKMAQMQVPPHMQVMPGQA